MARGGPMAPHWYFGAQGRRACRRGFIPPCLPTKIVRPPSGEPWLHEIKHDASEVLARKDGNRIRLHSCVNDVLRGNRAIYKARLGLLD